MVTTREDPSESVPTDLTSPEVPKPSSTTTRKPPKSLYEGTLVGRTDEHVILSLKGRKINIPRDKVVEVRLPKAKTELTDYEIQKLQ